MEHIMLLFDNGNESLCAFPASSLSVIDAANDTVLLYFGRHATKHLVTLACADGDSELVAATIGRELAKKYQNPKLHNVIVVADDTNSVYITDGVSSALAGGGITGVTSFGIDAG